MTITSLDPIRPCPRCLYCKTPTDADGMTSIFTDAFVCETCWRAEVTDLIVAHTVRKNPKATVKYENAVYRKLAPKTNAELLAIHDLFTN